MYRKYSRISLVCLGIVISHLPSCVSAAESSAVHITGFTWPYLGKLILSLVFMTLLLWGCARVLRRWQRFGSSSGHGLQVIASLPLGARERLVLVQAGEQQILLGLTPTQITPITELSEPLPSTDPSRVENFRTTLDRMINRAPA